MDNKSAKVSRDGKVFTVGRGFSYDRHMSRFIPEIILEEGSLRKNKDLLVI